MRLTKIEKVDDYDFKEICHVDEQGRKQGKYLSYYPDGSKWLECNYKDGILHGKYIEYRKNGIKKEERIFKDGNILKSTYYNEEGQKVEEHKYFYSMSEAFQHDEFKDMLYINL